MKISEGNPPSLSTVHCPLLSLLPRDQRNNYKNNRHDDDNRDDRAEDAAAFFLEHTGVGAVGRTGS